MRKDSCGLGSGSLLNFHRLRENLNVNKVYLPCFGDRWVTTIYILLGGFPWGSNHKNVAIIILHILDFKMTGCTHVRRWCELINSVPFTCCAKVTWRCPTWAQTVLDEQKENPSWVFFCIFALFYLLVLGVVLKILFLAHLLYESQIVAYLSVPITCLLWSLAWKELLERNEWIYFLYEFE